MDDILPDDILPDDIQPDILPDDIQPDILPDDDQPDILDDISGAQTGGRRRRKKAEMDDVQIARRKADADEVIRRKSETPEQTLQRRKSEGVERAEAARKRKADVSDARRVEVQRARKSQSLSSLQAKRSKTVETKKQVKRRETEKNVRQSRRNKERAATQQAPKKRLVESAKRSQSTKSDYVKSKREALTERHAAAAKSKTASEQTRRAADASIKRKERAAALQKKKGGVEEKRSKASADADKAATMTMNAKHPSADKPPVKDRMEPVKAKTDAEVTRVATQRDKTAKDASAAADKAAQQKTPRVPDGVDTPRIREAKAKADEAAVKAKDAKANKDAIENDMANKKQRLLDAKKETVPEKKPLEKMKTDKEEAARQKAKADEDAATLAKKKQDDEEANHSKNADDVKESMAHRGARYLVGASFLTGFPFPFPGTYGRRGRRPPLSYSVDKSPKTPGGLPTDLFSTARPADIYKAAILDGKQDGYAAGFSDGKEAGRGAAMNKEVPSRDAATLLKDIIAARKSTNVQIERQAFCVMKLAEVKVKGLNYIDAYPQCVDDTGKPAATVAAPTNPSAKDISGQEAYTNGYQQSFVAQYHIGYDAGFTKGREEALAGISGAPISGASGPSGAGEGPGASLEQAGGDNPCVRDLYESDSDEENFLTKEEFLYLLTRGVNKQRIEKIRRLITSASA